jgi:hypothetical protein
MVAVKVTDAHVIEAGARIARGALQKHVARDLGISGRGLRLRLKRLGLPTGKRGRPAGVPLQHCPTCRCKTSANASETQQEAPTAPQSAADVSESGGAR